MRVWLDDIRPAPLGCVWVKTAGEFIELFDKHWQEIEFVSFDHDLGEGASGYDALTHIEKRVAMEGVIPPQVLIVHSANPVGRANMYRCIASIRRMIPVK